MRQFVGGVLLLRPTSTDAAVPSRIIVGKTSEASSSPIRGTGRRHQGSARRHLAGQFYGVRSWLYRSGGKNLAAPGEPLRAKSVTYVSGTFCYLCLRNGH